MSKKKPREDGGPHASEERVRKLARLLEDEGDLAVVLADGRARTSSLLLLRCASEPLAALVEGSMREAAEKTVAFPDLSVRAWRVAAQALVPIDFEPDLTALSTEDLVPRSAGPVFLSLLRRRGRRGVPSSRHCHVPQFFGPLGVSRPGGVFR